MYSKEIKKRAIKLYMEGNRGKAVGRILGISKNTCLYWLKKYAKEIQTKSTVNIKENVIEMDELYSFIERKNLMLARGIKNFAIMGHTLHLKTKVKPIL